MTSRSESYDQLLQRIRALNPETGDWLRDTEHTLLRFLRDLFFQHDPQDSRSYHWEPNEERTRVIIRGTRTIDTSTLERLPAILLQRGRFDYGVASVDLRSELDLLTGSRVDNDLLAGSFQVHCLSSEGTEAGVLAVWIARCLRHFRQNVRQAGFFQIGRRISVGDEQDAAQFLDGASKRKFVDVPVAFPVYRQEIVSVAVTPESTRTLTSFGLHLRARGVRIDAGQVLPYYPLEVNGDGLPEGPHVLEQDVEVD